MCWLSIGLIPERIYPHAEKSCIQQFHHFVYLHRTLAQKRHSPGYNSVPLMSTADESKRCIAKGVTEHPTIIHLPQYVIFYVLPALRGWYLSIHLSLISSRINRVKPPGTLPKGKRASFQSHNLTKYSDAVKIQYKRQKRSLHCLKLLLNSVKKEGPWSNDSHLFFTT